VKLCLQYASEGVKIIRRIVFNHYGTPINCLELDISELRGGSRGHSRYGDYNWCNELNRSRQSTACGWREVIEHYVAIVTSSNNDRITCHSTGHIYLIKGCLETLLVRQTIAGWVGLYFTVYFVFDLYLHSPIRLHGLVLN
jgi:hypothetical protein